MKNFFNGMRPPNAGKGGKASDAFKAGLKKGSGRPMTSEEKYKKMFEDKISAGQRQNAGRVGFALPGTSAPSQEKKEMSKNMKLALEQMAATKAKKEAKRNKKLAKEDARIKKAAIRSEQMQKQQAATKAAAPATTWGSAEPSKNPSGGFWGGGSDKKDDGGWW